MANPFKLTLLRHGITLANEKKQYLGWTDASLNQNGRQQARETRQKLKNFETQAVISSDLIRCQETAEIIFPRREIKTMADFREMHFGQFELETYATLKMRQSYLSWINAPFTARPEAGESFHEFTVRVLAGIEKLAHSVEAQGLDDTTLITHGGVIKLLLTEFVGSQKQYFDWAVPNAQGYQLIWKDKSSFGRLEQCISLLAVPSMEKQSG